SQPCWNGIQPYRTSLDQAEAILRGQTQLVDNIERNDPSEGCALVWRSNSRPTVEGCIIARNGIVTSIELTGADNRNPIPL
ncbi:hypothetical protein, partial [Pseudomonas aeruginosa]|uniref:hypothetical protein n=1 Tax=Pseudomonas aeruginosa TaxID=287 RepID=UPI002B403CE4